MTRCPVGRAPVRVAGRAGGLAWRAVSPDPAATLTAAYATEGAALDLGRAVHAGALLPGVAVRVPLAMLNRHGLIAGATGTGRTKTLQVLAEQPPARACPCSWPT